MKSIRVADALNPYVKTLRMDSTVEDANRIMVENGFRGIPVVSPEEKVVGVVTMSDVIRVPAEKMKTTPIKDVMTKNVITISPNDSLMDALNKMTTNGIGRLPVVSPDSGKLIGILTRSDLFKAYSVETGL